MALMTALAIGATVAGSALAASSQKKAANKAADAQRYATDQNAQVQREQLQIAQGALSPYVQRGNTAGNAMNALLGLGGTQPSQSLPTPQPNALAQFQGYNPDTSASRFGSDGLGPRLGNDMFVNPRQIGGGEFGSEPQFAFAGQAPNSGPYDTPGFGSGTPMGGQTAQQAAGDAFDIFRNSTGYQFRLGEGMRAINGGFAGSGTLQSGAALKSLNDYGQNMASNEFGNYLGYLGNQQGAGLSGASALAGVGQNYANSISTNNNALAGALGNAALIKGQNNPFAAGLGALGGTILGGGFGR